MFEPGTVVKVVRDLLAEEIERQYERQVVRFRWFNRTGVIVGRDEDDGGKIVYWVEFDNGNGKTERSWFYPQELKQAAEQRVLVAVTEDEWEV